MKNLILRSAGRGASWTWVFTNLWALWVFVTLFDLLTLRNSGYVDSWSNIPHAIFDLFTPMLLGNLHAAFTRMTLPLMLVVLFFGNRYGARIPSRVGRVIYNLGILLVLTAAVDWITWGRPISIGHFVITMFGRHIPHSPTPL